MGRSPWSHVCIVSGFPNKVVALQFEWQWQNADKSRVMKKRKSVEKSKRRGYQVSLKVLHSLLDSQLWKRLNLKVHFLDKEMMRIFSSHFARGNSGDTIEGTASEYTKANAELNTPADFDSIHENRDVADRGQSHPHGDTSATLHVSSLRKAHNVIGGHHLVFVTRWMHHQPSPILPMSHQLLSYNYAETITSDVPCILCGHVVCTLAGAAQPITAADGETTGSAAAAAEVQSDNCPVADSRNRMWCCPVPTCNASSHLYCMAVSVHDLKVGQHVAAIRGACKSAYVDVKGATRDTVEVYKDRGNVARNKRIDEDDAVRRNSAKPLVPSRGTCNACGGSNSWADVVRAVCVRQVLKEVIKGKRKAAEMSSLQKARADEGTGSSDEDGDNAHTAANDISAERVLSRHDRDSNTQQGKEVIDLGSDSDEDEDEAGRDIMFIDDSSDDEDDVFMTGI